MLAWYCIKIWIVTCHYMWYFCSTQISMRFITVNCDNNIYIPSWTAAHATEKIHNLVFKENRERRAQIIVVITYKKLIKYSLNI